MNFSDLVTEVGTITGRPDRVAEIESAIKSATLKAHNSDYFYKDIFETGIAFTTSDFYQQLDYRALIPRYRAVKYLRKWDNVNSNPGLVLTLIAPENILDRYNAEKSDVYYIAGAFIQIKSSTSQQYYLFGCYLNPDVTKANYTSWIAQDHPYAIVFDAAATVFKAIGKDDEATNFRKLVDEQLQMIKISNILPNGY